MTLETEIADLISSATDLLEAVNVKKTALDTAVDDATTAATSAQAASTSLASTSGTAGASLVGYDGGTVQTVLDNAKALADYTALRTYTGRATGVYITATSLSGRFYLDSTDTTSVDNGGTIIVDGSGRRWKRLYSGSIDVRWFGAIGDNIADDTAAFTAAANYALTLQVGTNRAPILYVPNGNFRILSTTPPGTWWLEPGADIRGLGGVTPNYVTDTQRLTGTLVRFSGIDQNGTLTVGDSNYTVQKSIDNSFDAQVLGASNRAAAGITGTSFSSASDTWNQATIGIVGAVVNDNTVTKKPAWCVYLEGWRRAGVGGNLIGMESTVFNENTTYIDSPYRYISDDAVNSSGAVYNLWLTVGGTYDSSVALGIGKLGGSGAGVAYDKGIVVKVNSVNSGEALVLPDSYKTVWYSKNTTYTIGEKVASIYGYMNEGESAGNVVVELTDRSTSSMRGYQFSYTNFFPNSTMSLGKSTNYWTAGFINSVICNNIEIGQPGAGGSRYIDFNASGAAVDYEARIISSTGGGTVGSGDLAIISASLSIGSNTYPTTNNNRSLGTSTNRWSNTYTTNIRPGAGTVVWTSGTGSPEGVITASPGSMYTREDPTDASNILYVKVTGTGNTGWVAK